jgi:hypothetical protein
LHATIQAAVAKPVNVDLSLATLQSIQVALGKIDAHARSVGPAQ